MNYARKLNLAAALLTAGFLPAQSPAPPAFEVASVKQHIIPRGMLRRPWSPNINCGPIAQCGIAGNRFLELGSLVDLIMDAYSVRRYQVAGLPDWGDSGHDVYDINAKFEDGPVPSLDQVRRMLQTLLADRFQLKLHHETRDLPVYALVPTKNGPKLVPAQKACLLPAIAGGGGRGGRGPTPPPADDPGLSMLQSWAIMPELVSMFVDRPVIDKSGLNAPSYCTANGQDPVMTVLMEAGPGPGGGRGRGDAPPPPPDGNATSSGASIFTLIEEKWGLKLESQKAPTDVLIIDRVERPSEN